MSSTAVSRLQKAEPIRVAMVEDSRDIRGVLEELLQQVGRFSVISCVSTEGEATEWIEHNARSWDLAIIDLVLREGSGFNVIGRYRNANEQARIVVLSDYATTSIKVRCVELGADAVFTKGEIKAFAAYVGSYGARRSETGAVA